jgi:hypothetical protein
MDFAVVVLWGEGDFDAKASAMEVNKERKLLLGGFRNVKPSGYPCFRRDNYIFRFHAGLGIKRRGCDLGACNSLYSTIFVDFKKGRVVVGYFSTVA